MSCAWNPDVPITLELVTRLLDRQFPALAPARAELLGEGWDNAAYRVNDQYVFRFPRRAIGAALLERETRILPLLAPHLPLPVPVPRFLGRPEGDYPYPFAGYAMLPGCTACRVAWTDDARSAVATPLARFLRALHSIPVSSDTRAWAPDDDLGRADLGKRTPMIHEKLRNLGPRLHGMDVAALNELTDRLAAAPPWTGLSCWVHGDLYARHLLVDDARRLCGVIDWGDAHLGDPALDLSIAFSFLPFCARPVFREAYGEITQATWRRAQFRALFYGAVLVEYGMETGDGAIRDAGAYALRASVLEEEGH